MENGTRLAAVDMGSNSFRLEIGRLDRGQIHRTDYVKETVRLGAGLSPDGQLSDEAMARGWACLARFGERLAGLPRGQVRAVATQTLREARNRDTFLARAEQLLGFPIEVIAGHEEARLIYLGAAHLLPQSNERRLVIDIGGRSTEVITGQGLLPLRLASYPIGSVSWTQRHFPEGRLTHAAFAAADLDAKALLAELPERYPQALWDLAYGSSGTIGAVADALVQAGRSSGSVTREGLSWLREQLVRAGRVHALRLPGIRENRKPILAGGVAVLSAILDLLAIDALHPAAGALRQGVLYDLIDRERGDTDTRTASVARLSRQFAVDAAQAQRVQQTALHLWDSLVAQTRAPLPPAVETTLRQGLERAAALHEIGTAISHSGHPKHGAYILQHADVAGFAGHELARLAALVRHQRGKLLRDDTPIDWQDPGWVAQTACLRLAVLLCQARRGPELAGMTLRQRTARKPPRLILNLPLDWGQRSPLSWHLLGQEMQHWRRTPWQLVLEVAGERIKNFDSIN